MHLFPSLLSAVIQLNFPPFPRATRALRQTQREVMAGNREEQMGFKRRTHRLFEREMQSIIARNRAYFPL